MGQNSSTTRSTGNDTWKTAPTSSPRSSGSHGVGSLSRSPRLGRGTSGSTIARGLASTLPPSTVLSRQYHPDPTLDPRGSIGKITKSLYNLHIICCGLILLKNMTCDNQ